MSEAFAAARPGMDYIAERTGGEIVRDSLRIYREYFGPLLVIYALPVLPVLALSAYGNFTADPVALLVVGILDLLVAVFPYGAVTIAVADICLGNRPTLGSSYGAIARNFWRYVGTYALYMAIAIGAILVGVAAGGFLVGMGYPVAGFGLGAVALALALVWLFRYMFCCQVCILERRGPLQSLRRSRQLLRGSFWRVVGLSVAMFCLVWLVLIAVMVVWSAALATFPEVNIVFFNDVFARLLTIAATPALLIAFVLIYYDLRVRKENYDSDALTLELMS